MKIVKPLIDILMQFMVSAMPSCEEITIKISESMDLPIKVIDRIRINMHVMICKFCRYYRTQLIIIRWILQKISGIDDMHGATSDLRLSFNARDRIKRAINESKQG